MFPRNIYIAVLTPCIPALMFPCIYQCFIVRVVGRAVNRAKSFRFHNVLSNVRTKIMALVCHLAYSCLTPCFGTLIKFGPSGWQTIK